MLGALASVLATWLVTGVLVFEAIGRIINPSPVDGKGGCLNRLNHTPSRTHTSFPEDMTQP